MIVHSGLPPSIEVNNLEITLLYNYVYSEIFMLRNVEQTRETTLYTTAARVLYRGNDCVIKNFYNSPSTLSANSKELLHYKTYLVVEMNK